MPDGVPKIAIPRWIQLVGLPLLVLLAWAMAHTLSRALFLFIVAGLIALLLNPMVRALGRVWIPRGLAVAVVFLSFAAAVGLCVLVLAMLAVDRGRSTIDRVDNYFTVKNRLGQTGATRDVDRLQAWLDTHHLKSIQIRKEGTKYVSKLSVSDVTSKIHWIGGAAVSTLEILISIVLVVVVSIYMLLDMGRLGRALDRRFPPRQGSPPLLTMLEQALASYVKGQVLLSLIIGTSAGVGLWILGTLNLFPGGERYAFFFGLWVAFMELIPYLGPWLGAIPPVIYALVIHPIAAVWVVLLFLGIHQIEGHVVVPQVMGSALRLHPLLVIFGLLAGLEIYGVLGVLVVLPLLAVLRALWEFFSERMTLEAWTDAGPVPVGVTIEGPPSAPATPSATEAPLAETAAAEAAAGEQATETPIAPDEELAAE
jgi:predicted PurR-regulated permease PerM